MIMTITVEILVVAALLVTVTSQNCPHCGEVDFSSAEFYINGQKATEPPTMSKNDTQLPGYTLCSAVEKRVCSDTGEEDPDCAKYQISMSITGSMSFSEGGEMYDYRWVGVKLHMRDCLAKGATCKDIFVEIAKLQEKVRELQVQSYVHDMKFTNTGCELQICDNNGEDCDIQDSHSVDEGEEGDGDDDTHDDNCHLPDLISGGYKFSEGVYEGQKYAVYVCSAPFVMTPNKESFGGHMAMFNKTAHQAYMDTAHIGGCYAGKVYVPECRDPRKAGHCGIPRWIKDGTAVEVMIKEREGEEENGGKDNENKKESDEEEIDEDEKRFRAMMPIGARYECNAGYVMHQTVKGDWGWCRSDGSYELPRCEHEDNFYRLEFKLDNGRDRKFVDKEGRVFGGIVQARLIGPTEGAIAMGDWEYGCNDGFNNNAAGAICRTLGFQHGAQTALTKKIQSSSTGETEKENSFGWTHFACQYDDTLPQSMHCKATRYEEAMKKMGRKAICFDFDRMAIKCFNHAMFNVDVELDISGRKVTCQVWAEKQGYALYVDKLTGIEVKWMLDDREIELDYKYNRRKGFSAKVRDLNKLDFRCMSCEIYIEGAMLGKGEQCRDES